MGTGKGQEGEFLAMPPETKSAIQTLAEVAKDCAEDLEHHAKFKTAACHKLERVLAPALAQEKQLREALELFLKAVDWDGTLIHLKNRSPMMGQAITAARAALKGL